MFYLLNFIKLSVINFFVDLIIKNDFFCLCK